ncbi:hypothetical protein SLA2020_414720 [Shorea laevis]
MCWQAAILDQEISPPPLAVKKIFQFLKAATAFEHQDWVLEVRCSSTGNGCSSFRCSSTGIGCSISKLLAALQLLNTYLQA